MILSYDLSEASFPSDREIRITRLLNAPRELVFQAWTNPEHLARWWGPEGFTTTTHSMDFRPGGEWRFVMHGPDGTDYQNRIVYDEIVPHEKLVYHHRGEADVEPVIFTSTILFEDLDGKTRVTMNSLFPTGEHRDQVIRDYGAVEGGKQHLARLAEFTQQT